MNNTKKILVTVCIILIFSVSTVYAANNGYVGQNICGQNAVKQLLKWAGYLFMLARVVVPLIIIIVGMLDMFKAVTGNEEGLLKTQFLVLLVRIGLGIFVFFIPTIVRVVVDMYFEISDPTATNYECFDCFLSPTKCK